MKGDELLRDTLGYSYGVLAALAMELTLDLNVEVNRHGVIYDINGEKYKPEVRARLIAGFEEVVDGQAIVDNDLWLRTSFPKRRGVI